jgi:protein-S-isoprenylcysteine O-methyltransferase Ste14
MCLVRQFSCGRSESTTSSWRGPYQHEARQTVCQDGPYHYLRHPGYLGGLLFGLSSPLVLGSLWAVIPAALAAALLVVRAALEDRTLQAELPGYSAYTQEVKYRLLPGVW